MRCFSCTLLALLLLLATTVAAQPLSSTPPPDPAQVGLWREAWYAWGREVRAWRATRELGALQGCLTREMARYGVSPAWFAKLYETAPRPSIYVPPLHRGTVTTTCTTTGEAWTLRTICSTTID